MLDIGANYGEMLVGVSLPPSARVVAFEPNPVVRGFLERTIAEAELAVEVSPLAVGREPGELEFAIDTSWSGTSTLRDAPLLTDERWLHERVAVTTIDAITAGAESVCIKIDVEGFEFDVIDGAQELIASGRPLAMMLEILHMSPAAVARLAARHPLYVLDIRRAALVRVPAGNADLVSSFLRSGWVYPQDGVLALADAIDARGAA